MAYQHIKGHSVMNFRFYILFTSTIFMFIILINTACKTYIIIIIL